MTLYEFNVLKLDEKQTIVLEKGIFLNNYINEGIRINCYAIDMIFVEVMYNAAHNVITQIRSFKSGDAFNKYLKIK